MGVLITSAGRRNYLVRYFKKALRGQGGVFAADASPSAPALSHADRQFVVPKCMEKEYIPRILALCEENKVELIVPLNDLELPVLAAHRGTFINKGIFPLVPSQEIIDLCFDKMKTPRFLKGCGADSPLTYNRLDDALAALDEGDIQFPLMVKPRWGSASIGLCDVENRTSLESYFMLLKNNLPKTVLGVVGSQNDSVIVQEKLEGMEYGLDVVNDLEGRHAATFAKKKLAMRGGETDRAVTVADERLDNLGKKIGQSLNHVGNLDCDAFIADDKISILEMNPRFGGGYPFSHMAGANVPAALLAWLKGEEPDPDWLRVKPGVASAKYDDLVIIPE